MQDVAVSPVRLGAAGLEVTLNDGDSTYFNYYWLRDNCPTSFDSRTRERSFDIVSLEAPPRPDAAAIEGDVLVIHWAGEGHVSRFPMTWLETYADGKRRDDPADLARKPWYADHLPALQRFTQQQLLSDPKAVVAWAEALMVDGIALVSGMENSDDSLTRTALLLGQVRPTFFGPYFEVRTQANPINLSYTPAALEMHTDTPAEDESPGIQFLHCRINDATGGETLFLDGVAVANEFRELHPEDFKILSETRVPFYCEHDTFDMRSRQRVIELDDHGAVSGLTYSQHMADIFDLPQKFLDHYYPAFCRFGQLMQSEKYLIQLRLNAGDCITFDNHRIVHGRAAFVAESGGRHLRGCYVDRGELRSTYRALTSEGRFK